MQVLDKNFTIISNFIASSNEPPEDQAFWQLGYQLEDMSCLFKIATIFSCFLKCICLEGWYLDQVKDVYREYTALRTAEIEKIKTSLRTEGHYTLEIVESAAAATAKIPFLSEMEKTMSAALPKMAQTARENQDHWDKMIKGFNDEYTERLPQFAPFFSGLRKGTEEDFKAFVKAYHAHLTQEIVSTSPAHHQAVMQEAANKWLEKAQEHVVKKRDIAQALIANFHAIHSKNPALRDGWLARFNGKPADFLQFLEKCKESPRFARLFEGTRASTDEDQAELEMRYQLDRSLQTIKKFEEYMDPVARAIFEKNRAFLVQHPHDISLLHQGATQHIAWIAAELESCKDTLLKQNVVNTLMRMTSLNTKEETFTSYIQSYPNVDHQVESADRKGNGVKQTVCSVHAVLAKPEANKSISAINPIFVQFYLTFGLIRGCNSSGDTTFIKEENGIQSICDITKDGDFIRPNFGHQLEDGNETNLSSMIAMSFPQSIVPYSKIVLKLFAWRGLKEKITKELDKRDHEYAKEDLEERLDKIVEICRFESHLADSLLCSRDLFFMIYGKDFMYYKYKEQKRSAYAFFSEGIGKDDNEGSHTQLKRKKDFPMPNIVEKYPCQKALGDIRGALKEKGQFEIGLSSPESFNEKGWKAYIEQCNQEEVATQDFMLA